MAWRDQRNEQEAKSKVNSAHKKLIRARRREAAYAKSLSGLVKRERDKEIRLRRYMAARRRRDITNMHRADRIRTRKYEAARKRMARRKVLQDKKRAVAQKKAAEKRRKLKERLDRRDILKRQQINKKVIRMKDREKKQCDSCCYKD